MMDVHTSDPEHTTTEQSHGERYVDSLNEEAWKIRNNDIERAALLTDESSTLAHRLGYQRGIAYSNLMLALRENFQGKYESALHRLFEALVLFEYTHDKRGCGRAYFLMGYGYWGTGEYDEGLAYMLKGLDIAQSADDSEVVMWCYYSLGVFYFDLNDFQQSLEHYEKSLLLARNLDNQFAEARALNGIGNVCIGIGESTRALQYLQESLNIAQTLGNQAAIVRALHDMAAVYVTSGDLSDALHLYEQSLEIREHIQQKQGIISTLLDLGKLYVRQHQTEKALEYLNRSLAIAEEINARPKLFRIHLVLSEVYEETGNIPRALWHYKTYSRVKDQVSGDEHNTRYKNLRTAFQAAKSQQEAEIIRLRNVELAEVNAQLHQAYKMVEKERTRSEQLLLNILPSKIAERLKSGERLIAEKFDCVTVMFIDLVKFTELSSENSAEEVVQMLNWIFSKFDGLSEHFGLEKIKTIGDSYMVASGLPTPREDHAK
ncbi:tetratricopeptide repeat protein, partial [candidate division KSB1 bacterium]|nr:tetratricopeptide repeat protein [candidate division KSB1 bacterium]